jgi:methionine salvage enolase-phosphatase E1
MANQNTDLDSLVKALYDFASQKMKENASDEEIVTALGERGLTREYSLIIVDNLRKVFNAARRRP